MKEVRCDINPLYDTHGRTSSIQVKHQSRHPATPFPFKKLHAAETKPRLEDTPRCDVDPRDCVHRGYWSDSVGMSEMDAAEEEETARCPVFPHSGGAGRGIVRGREQ